jgi:hypothetical protein
MKVLVRRTGTGLFLKTDGSWTSESNEAHDLVSCPKAVEHICGLKLTRVEIILAFDDSSLTMTLPVCP